jgi:peptidoglycan L-alanyl-D-glutamate endopeptidase CwlK
MYKLSDRSLKNLDGVDPKLVSVVKRAIQITKQDFMVLCGVRTLEQQKELYAQGRTKPGNIITWTLNSKHLPASDGFGKAVDLIPYPVDWSDNKRFDEIAGAMLTAANELYVNVRWGADWDMDGIPRERDESDSPHFELI